MRKAFVAMPAFYVGTFVIYGFAKVAQSALLEHPQYTATLLGSSALSHQLLYFAGSLQGLVSLAAVAVGAVATHRFILLDDVRPKLGRNALRFFLWLIFLGVIFLLLEVAKSLDKKAMPDSGLTAAIGVVTWVVWLVVVIYFAPLFPSVAVAEKAKGWRERIVTSWTRMDGNFWLFLGGAILAALPLVLALILITLVTLTFSVFGATLGNLSAIDWGWLLGLLRDLVQFPVFMVHAAVASWLYAWVQQQSGPALEPIGHA